MKSRRKYKVSSIRKDNSRDKYIHYLILTGIIILTIIIYSGSLKNDFITNWDDNKQVVKNEDIKDLTTDNIRKIFSSYYVGMYQPLATLSYAIEYKLSGLNPLPYHADNLLLHLLNIILVYIFIYSLTKSCKTSSITALLFGIHPMNVEVIALISARSSDMYSFFFLGGLITYIKYLKSTYNRPRSTEKTENLKVRSHKPLYLILTYLLFILSLLSKSAAVCFPLVLILIDYYFNSIKTQESRHKTQESSIRTQMLSVKYWMNKVPFFIIAVIFGIVSIYSRESIGGEEYFSYSIIDRIFLVTYSAAYYIIKLIVPTGLCAWHFYYVKTSEMLPIEYYLSAAFIAGIVITIILLKSAKLKKDIIFGILFFLATIVLVLQIIPFRSSLTPEHYAYIPYIGLFFIISRQSSVINRQLFKIIIILFVIILSIITYQRNKVWANSLSLYNDIVEKNPKSWLAYDNRANVKNSLGDLEGAKEDLNKTIELNPSIVKAYNDRGTTKYKLADMEGAIEDFNKAIELNPKFALAYNNRGNAKYAIGDKQGAIEDFDKAIALNPKLVQALNDRGTAKYKQNDKEGAIKDFNRAIEIDSKFALSFNNRANVKYSTGDKHGAIEDYNKAIELYPKYAVAFYNRGLAKNDLNDRDGACIDWEKAGELGYKGAYEMMEKYCR